MKNTTSPVPLARKSTSRLTGGTVRFSRIETQVRFVPGNPSWLAQWLPIRRCNETRVPRTPSLPGRRQLAYSPPSADLRAAESAAGIALRAPEGRAEVGTSSRRIRLEAVHRSTPFARCVLGLGKATLGSDESCDVRIPVDGVAPRHCLLVVGEDRIIIKAWSPQTWINEGAVSEGTLRIGDRLILGPMELRVLSEAAAPVAPLSEETLRETVRELQVVQESTARTPVVPAPEPTLIRQQHLDDLLEEVQQGLDHLLQRESDAQQICLRERLVLEHRARELDQQRDALLRRERELAALPPTVAPLPVTAAGSEQRARELAEWESQLHSRYEELAQRAGELAQRNRSLRWKARDLSEIDRRRLAAEESERLVRNLHARQNAQQRQLEAHSQALAAQAESVQTQFSDLDRQQQTLTLDRKRLEEESRTWDKQRRSRESLLNDLEESLASRTREVGREEERLAEWEIRLLTERKEINELRFSQDVAENSLRRNLDTHTEEQERAAVKLQEQREALEREFAELAEARQQLEHERAGLLSRFEACEQLRGELAEREQSAANRQLELDCRGAEIEAETARLDELRQELDFRRTAIEEQARELELGRQSANELNELHDRHQVAVQELERELAERSTRLIEIERQKEESERNWQQSLAEMEARQTTLDQSREELRVEAESLAELRLRLESQERDLRLQAEELRSAGPQANSQDPDFDLSALRELLAARDGELTAAREQLAGASCPITSAVIDDGQRGQDLEQREVALHKKELEVRQHRECLEEREAELRRQLEALDTRTDELQGRSQQLDERETGLRKTELQLSQQKSEFEQQESSLRAEQEELARLRTELDRRAATAVERPSVDVEFTPAQREERHELARLRAKLDVEKIEQAREASRLQEVKQKLERETRKLDDERLALVDERDTLAAERAELTEQSEELERRRAELEVEFQGRAEQQTASTEKHEKQSSSTAPEKREAEPVPDGDYDSWRASVLARFGLEAPAADAAVSPPTRYEEGLDAAAIESADSVAGQVSDDSSNSERHSPSKPAAGGLRSELAEMFGLKPGATSGEAHAEILADTDSVVDPEAGPPPEVHAPSQDRLDRMLGGISRSAANSPLAAAPPPPPRRDLSFAEDADVESSVASYMEGLLARSRTGGQPTQAPEARPAAPVAPPPQANRSEPTSRQPAAAPEEEPQRKTRKLKPEDKESLRANLDSFRELANQSARTAVAKSQVTRKQTNLKGVASLALLGWVTTGIFLSTELWMTSPQRLLALGSGLVAMVLSVLAYLRHGEIRLLRGGHREVAVPERHSADVAPVADDQPADEEEGPNSNPLSFL